MRVRLTVSGSGHGNAGDIIDVPSNEAIRMIQDEQAESAPRKRETAERKIQRKAVRTRT